MTHRVGKLLAIVLFAPAVVLLICSNQSYADTTLPLADGNVSNFGIVNSTDDEITVARTNAVTIQGVIEFELTEPLGKYDRAYLSLTPDSSPFRINPVQLYAYAAADGEVTAGDFDRGAFLRLLEFPADGIFQPHLFDVTAFVASADDAALGFSLRTDEFVGDFVASERPGGEAPKVVIVRSQPVPLLPVPALLMLVSLLFIIALRSVRKR